MTSRQGINPFTQEQAGRDWRRVAGRGWRYPECLRRGTDRRSQIFYLIELGKDRPIFFFALFDLILRTASWR